MRRHLVGGALVEVEAAQPQHEPAHEHREHGATPRRRHAEADRLQNLAREDAPLGEPAAPQQLIDLKAAQIDLFGAAGLVRGLAEHVRRLVETTGV